MLEQFLETLPGDMRIWLCERKPTTAKEASSMADDYRAARRRKRPDVPKTDSQKKEGPSKKCYRCQQEGHVAVNCKEKQLDDSNTRTERVRDKADRRCYNCHQRGHLARDCPGAF